jgi:hypothetical protein
VNSLGSFATLGKEALWSAVAVCGKHAVATPPQTVSTKAYIGDSQEDHLKAYKVMIF